MICEECGTVFERRSKRGTIPRFCSSRCNSKNWRRNNPDRMSVMNERQKNKPGESERRRRYHKRKREADPTYFARLFWTRKKKWVQHLGGACSCGERRLPCLDFDHRDPKTKTYDVSFMLKYPGRFSEDVLRTEVDKCTLLCSNCHRVKTSKHWAGLAELFLSN